MGWHALILADRRAAFFTGRRGLGAKVQRGEKSPGAAIHWARLDRLVDASLCVGPAATALDDALF